MFDRCYYLGGFAKWVSTVCVLYW